MKGERKVIELNMNDILPNRFQPRITFGEDAINELAESIKEHGVIQPIVVRRINDKYEIIAGERRFKASQIAGKTTIPAIITDLNDKESAEIALIENVQREDLTPIEEAVSYKKILDMGYLTQEELSGKLGKKQSTISNKLRLLNLDEEVQEALLEKKISERHARSLLKLSEKDQRDMLTRIITERLTVRKTDEEIDKILNQSKTPKPSATITNNQNEDDIEVLNINEEEKEGNDMNNNEINQNFNIPVDPIIEEPTVSTGIEPNVVTPQSNMGAINVEPTPMVATMPTTAPGFMDVDKIANTATDINVEKPAVNMDNLLKPTPAPTAMATETPAVDTSIFGFTPVPPESAAPTTPAPTNDNASDESILKPGKFFDLNSLGDIQEPASPETTPAEPEISLKATSEPVAPTPVEEVKEASAAPSQSTSSMFGINLEPKNPDFVGNVESKEANVDFGIPNPTIDSTNLNFDSFYDKTPAPASPVEIPSIPETPATPAPTPAAEPVAQPVVETPVNVTPEPVVNNAQVTEPSPAVSPAPQPTLQPSATPDYTVPSASELDAFLSNLDSTTPLTTTNTMAASNNNAVATAQETPKVVIDASKMSKVINIMHEAKDKIAALGISVDLDEFDFDDMYQAIFKIDK